MDDHRDCILGLDLGTTSLKCAVICKDDKTVVASSSVYIDAYVCKGLFGEDVPTHFKEQNTVKIIKDLIRMIEQLPRSVTSRVSSVGNRYTLLSVTALNRFYR